jgi:Replication-relaxation
VLHLVDRCRFVDSRQLRLTLGRGLNERAFLRRLQALFHAELLDRPPQQLRRWWVHGRAKHYVYALGIEGHRLLYPELHRKGAKTDWRLRNRRAEALYMEHRLAVSEVILSFVLAAEQLGLQVPAWHDGDSFHRATGLPRRIEIPWRGDSLAVPLHPDGYFVLAREDRREHFLLEVDRGTEPIARSQWSGTSIRRKLAAYWQVYASRLNERAGMPSFRVLTVTTSQTRVENMRALARAMDPKGRGSALFLFSTADRITLNNPLPVLKAPIWQTPLAENTLRVLV